MDAELLRLLEDWTIFKTDKARIYLEPVTSVPPRLVVDEGSGNPPVMVAMTRQALRALALRILDQVGTK